MSEVGASGLADAILSLDLIKFDSCRDGLTALVNGHQALIGFGCYISLMLSLKTKRESH